MNDSYLEGVYQQCSHIVMLYERYADGVNIAPSVAAAIHPGDQSGLFPLRALGIDGQ